MAALTQHSGAPTAEQWKEAAAALKDHHEEGEPLLFAPHWVSPLGRLHFGKYITPDTTAISDVGRYARVWLVSTRGERHPWLRGLEPAETWQHGAVRVELYKKPARKVTYDFTARVLEAQVERAGRTVTRCKLQGRRFTCAPHSWNWVGPHLAEVGHKPYRCIFAHAVDGHTMRITFPAVPLGRSLVGYTGIDDFENRKRNDAAVALKVLIGSRAVGQVTHENSSNWSRFSFSTGEAAGQTHPVHFEITTKHAFSRTFCFSAEARQ